MAAPNADHDGPRSDDDDGPREPDRPDPPEPLDVDARWEQIVAELDDTPTDTPPSARPAPHEPPADRRGLAGIPVAPWVTPPGPRDWPTTPEVEALEDEQDRFVPPDPPPMTGRSPLLTLAWVLAVVSPLVFLLTAILVRPIPSLVAQGCTVGFVVGVGLLLWKLPAHRDPEDSDPGAVV